MKNASKIRKTLISLLAVIALMCSALVAVPAASADLVSPQTVDILSATQAGQWFHNEAEVESNPGTWAVTAQGVTADTYGCAYAMEGATYLSEAGVAYGAYEMEASFVINQLNSVENPMIGIIPWYIDNENFVFVQLKFSYSDQYKTTDAERADGYGLQEIIVSGRLGGEAKFNSLTTQQENTVFGSDNVNVVTAKRNPLSAEGHTVKVTVENSSSAGNFLQYTVYYNGVQIGYAQAYYNNRIVKNNAVGFMGQDVKATFTSATVTDGYATNKKPIMARDWTEKQGYTYRVLNGVDTWQFDANGGVAVKAAKNEEGTSEFTVSGSNLGSYNTNRGFTVNELAATAEGVPQNYEVSATFKAEGIEEYTGKKYVFGYGIMPWFVDDQSFISATIRRTEEGRKGFSTVKYEVVLYGWVENSNLKVGTTVYALPDTFDPMAEHTLTVQKKSIGFYVYLDGGAEPVISKRIVGTDQNAYYGYEGYNVNFSASAISCKSIYGAYDEVSMLGQDGNIWKNAGKALDAWSFEQNGAITLSAKEEGNALGKRSYLLGASDISENNVTVSANVTAELGEGFSELLLAPYILDESNFVRAGIAWKADGLYARIYASTFTDEDDFEGRGVTYTLKESKLSGVTLEETFTLTVKKIGLNVGVEVNGTLVYGLEIADINEVTVDYGVYAYNMNATLNSLTTDGYKKYTKVMVGDWMTSGIKNNQWSINSDGWLISDATYTDDMTPSNLDDDKSWALRENANADYTITATMRVTAESRAEDRVGLVLWYVDQENYLIFYMDRWRADSAVPRTTLTGLINGEYLPTRYNHGGWFPEGDDPIESAGGLTRTQLSQLDQFHTITVTKKGNRFTCAVDGSIGKLTYDVAAGLPSTAGKTVYSGIYALNDAIEVSQYAVTPDGEEVALTTPNDPSEATNFVEESLELGTYTDAGYTDEFDGVKSSDAGADEPGENPGENPGDNPGEEPGENPGENPGDKPGKDDGNSGSATGIIIAIVAVLVAGVAVAVIIKKKNKK